MGHVGLVNKNCVFLEFWGEVLQSEDVVIVGLQIRMKVYLSE